MALFAFDFFIDDACISLKIVEKQQILVHFCLLLYFLDGAVDGIVLSLDMVVELSMFAVGVFEVFLEGGLFGLALGLFALLD